MSSYSPPKPFYLNPAIDLETDRSWLNGRWLNGRMLAAAAFLVSVPVFIQAPLVRLFPWISLLATLGWLALSLRLRKQAQWFIWGDLLMGFSWTWLAGSLYWGWLRWEPLIHLPVEAIGLPFACWGLWRGKHQIGNWFYLGSLLGTAVTDLYFYLVGLIPHWRQLMIEPSLATTILRSAVEQVQTPWGINCAIGLIVLLLGVGCLPLRLPQLHWWAFGGAVLSTLLVDGLFWLGAAVV
ncbi:MAG: DUF3120 domain-containing protein [Elainella sp. Prado103]|nr:DUF3120 domain-containing protein [Elainella sp. Prado103]